MSLPVHEQDLSAGYNAAQASYESKFEALMEKFFHQKSETVEWIRDKYNKQIDELSNDDSPVVQMVIE